MVALLVIQMGGSWLKCTAMWTGLHAKCLATRGQGDSLPLSTGACSQFSRQVSVCSERHELCGVLRRGQAHMARAVFLLQMAGENLTISLLKPLALELSGFNLYFSQKCYLRVPGTKLTQERSGVISLCQLKSFFTDLRENFKRDSSPENENRFTHTLVVPNWYKVLC